MSPSSDSANAAGISLVFLAPFFSPLFATTLNHYTTLAGRLWNRGESRHNLFCSLTFLFIENSENTISWHKTSVSYTSEESPVHTAAEKGRDGVGKEQEHRTARQHCPHLAIRKGRSARHLRVEKSPNLVKNLISFILTILCPGAVSVWCRLRRR